MSAIDIAALVCAAIGMGAACVASCLVQDERSSEEVAYGYEGWWLL